MFDLIDVTFVDKNVANDPGFTLTLSQRTQYQQVSTQPIRNLRNQTLILLSFGTTNIHCLD